MPGIKCEHCSKVLASKTSLYNHRRRKHLDKYQPQPAKFGCNLCDKFKASTNKELIWHYNQCHGRNIKVLTEEFVLDSDFDKWKTELEKETSSWFVQHSGKKCMQGRETTHFYCNRSGVYVTTSKGVRALKSQGSSKMGGRCPAFITKRTHKASGLISVDFCADHVGHGKQICHLRLSDEMRSLIRMKLECGVEPEELLDEIRNNLAQVDRDAIVTKADILNIRKQFKVVVSEKHEEDKQSGPMWVKELSTSSDYDPIVLHKQEGISHPGLHKEDFLMCVQTEFQKYAWKEFGRRIICVDSSQSGNFLVTTVLVVDGFGEVIPAAWIFSHAEDADLLMCAFASLKDRCGDLVTEVFMSDLCDHLFDSWNSVFAPPLQRLYCNWAVDKSWRMNVAECVTDSATQASVYANLKALQFESDAKKFRQKLKKAEETFDDASPQFLEYFLREFVWDDKCKLWASCFRAGFVASTNTNVEAACKALRSVYSGKDRLEDLVVSLLRFSRDKCHEQFAKLQKGNSTGRVAQMRKQHKLASALKDDVRREDENEWRIDGRGSKGDIVMRKVQAHCPQNCEARCAACGVCIHTYTCTCPNFRLRGMACKHIHAVKMLNGSDGSEDEPSPDQSKSHDELQAVFRNTLIASKDSSNSLTPQQAQFVKGLDELRELAKATQDPECLSAMQRHVMSAIQAGKRFKVKPIENFSLRKKLAASDSEAAQTRATPSQRRRIIIKVKKPVA